MRQAGDSGRATDDRGRKDRSTAEAPANDSVGLPGQGANAQGRAQEHGDAAKCELQARLELRQIEARSAGAAKQKHERRIAELESEIEAARRELEASKRRCGDFENEAASIQTQLGGVVRVHKGALSELEALASDLHTVIAPDALLALTRE